MGRSHPRARGITLIEALVTVAILGIVIAIAVPSAVDWIRIQRVKATAAELATDIQFARAEAVRRSRPISIHFASDVGQTCYTVYAFNGQSICNCTRGAGMACPTDHAVLLYELKTVSVPLATGVSVSANQNLLFDATRALPKGLDAIGLSTSLPSLQADIDGGGSRQLRVVTNAAGRPHICAPSGSKIIGYAACT
jgi:type IV fimbrial biogenesis protein FimT